MNEDRSLARFTRDISSDGALDEVLRLTPPEDLTAALAALAIDRGYRVRPEELRVFLAGLDARFS